MPPNPAVGYDAYALHGHRQLLRFRQLVLKSRGTTPGPGGLEISTYRPYSTLPATPAASSLEPVGILGAGVGGLYAALIFEDLGIPYQIIEATNRVGGRLLTRYFEDPTGAPYNYFDLGAMRYPKTDFMKRVFHLFYYPPLNEPGFGVPLADRLRPFYFKATPENNAFLSYNGVTLRQNELKKPAPLPSSSDPFKANEILLNPHAQAYIRAGTTAIMDDVVAPFCQALFDDLENNTETGWDKLMQFDKYSARAYMALAYKPNASLGIPDESLPSDVINWIETFENSTGSFDMSLAETVLDALAFGWQPPSPKSLPPVEWFCIDGGSSKISETMRDYIERKRPNAISYNTRVTAIACESTTGMTITTTSPSSQTAYTFPNVISTLPLPVLRSIDLRNAQLSPRQQNALRELNYGPSTKIGVQFKSAWWTTAKDRDGKDIAIRGGASYTDKMLRTVVYPSFGDIENGKTPTLIASYCWTEDALRFAALFEKDPEFLKTLVLRDLADIHNISEELLRQQHIETIPWNWGSDEYTMGAFAFFGPGKFSDLYTAMNVPAGGGRLHFAGEAISVRHAWVEGALDSAWHAVHGLLWQPQYDPKFGNYRQKFVDNWGMNPEWAVRGLGGVKPDESVGGPGHKLPQPNFDPFERDLKKNQSLLAGHMAIMEQLEAEDKKNKGA